MPQGNKIRYLNNFLSQRHLLSFLFVIYMTKVERNKCLTIKKRKKNELRCFNGVNR